MRRLPIRERPDWRAQAEAVGFDFHTIDGEPYWDESACYQFTLRQIEDDLEDPTQELLEMCYEAVERILRSEELLGRLAIPRYLWEYMRASWERNDRDLYGRFDLRYDGTNPAKLYEFNADTPTSLFETAVFQWHWLEQARDEGRVDRAADQFNSVHEQLIYGFNNLGMGRRILHFSCVRDHAEDRGTVGYLMDCAGQAGIETCFLYIDEIGVTGDGRFTDLRDRVLTDWFKLYPWEWLASEEFGRYLPEDTVRIIEPVWKMALSNKGLLAVLWALCPGHPNLLPTYFDDDPKAASLGDAYVKKPLLGREGANVEVYGGSANRILEGPYGAEGFVRQARADLPDFDGNRPVIGSWVVAGKACGIGIREDFNPITSNRSRFLPHVIVG
jgi:glutathionylspermidine synthase